MTENEMWIKFQEGIKYLESIKYSVLETEYFTIFVNAEWKDSDESAVCGYLQVEFKDSCPDEIQYLIEERYCLIEPTSKFYKFVEKHKQSVKEFIDTINMWGKNHFNDERYFWDNEENNDR